MSQNKKEILAIIPARGGSKGIPGKNMVMLAGYPLIEYTFEAAQRSKYLTRIVLSTDDEMIAGLAKKNSIEVPFIRPGHLAQDDTPMLPVIRDLLSKLRKREEYVPDYIMILQPTSPLRSARHIDEAIEKLIASGTDSIVSVVELPHNFNPYSIMKLEDGMLKPFLQYEENRNLRQLKPKFYARNGAAIYAFRNTVLLEKSSIYGDTCIPYFMRPEESVDIDGEFDLFMAESIISKGKEKVSYAKPD
jgi:CMP-N-acetylneuraminic acid synthetase